MLLADHTDCEAGVHNLFRRIKINVRAWRQNIDVARYVSGGRESCRWHYLHYIMGYDFCTTMLEPIAR